MTHSVFGPSRGLALVAGSARIRDLVLVGHSWRDEAKSVGMNKRAGHAFAFNRWHMAGHTFASGTARFVVRVFFEGGRVRTIRGCRTVTI